MFSWIVCVESVTSFGEIDAFEMSSRAGKPRSLALIVPVPAGQPVADAAGTGAVCFETNVVEPFAFVAVTETRNVPPASAGVTTCVAAVAPEIAAQSSPFALQRSQAMATEVGLPLQVP